MTKLSKTILESSAVLILGLAVVGSLVFALAHRAEANNGGAKSVGSPLEVMISDNGHAVVRGAEVTSVSNTVITAKTEWGASSIVWNIRTDGDTQFVKKNGSSDDLDDIDVGEYVSFSGALDGTGSTFSVDADVVKNWSTDPKNDEDHKADLEARAEAKAEMKSRWSEWKEKFPLFHWFGKKDTK